MDCRWLGLGGAGRATELLLRGLATIRPQGRFVLWGPETVQRYLWPSATWNISLRRPTAMAGQADLFGAPAHDAALYMHQIRPLQRRASMTVVYDTIPLRYGGNALVRASKRSYLRTMARISTRIATLSRFAAASIHRDLGVPHEKISVIDYPVDHEMRDRIEELRRQETPQDMVLYVGRFAPHKNLPRLIRAFAATQLAKEGTRLLLVGGTQNEIDRLRPLTDNVDASIDLHSTCSQEELERLYATSRLLVMPSLEEGFGLPAWEAVAAGLRICVSAIPTFREILPTAPSFDPLSISEISSTLDLAVDAPVVRPYQKPTIEEYAREFLAEIRHLVA